jgi:SAM-dependent methyltransferase
LELGTGWSPVILLIFSLAGCKSLTLVDSQRLMDRHSFRETCQKLLIHKDKISQKLQVASIDIEKRLGKLSTMSFEAALIELQCHYLAPYNLLNKDIAENSYDIITSRAVLEHVPPQIVRNIFFEFNRILRPNGYMCHIIDNSDHWEHIDKSIGRLNFLKYSQAVFDLISSMNPLDYQNRLRHSQYKKMLEDTGFKIVCDASPSDEKSLADLKTMQIHPTFSQFVREDLAILVSYLVAAK